MSKIFGVSGPSKVFGLSSPKKIFGVDFSLATVPYGVMWDTGNSSPTLTKGYLTGSTWTAGNHPSIDVQLAMKRCVLNAAGAHQYYLDANNSIYKAGQTTPTASGSATSTSAGHLVNAAAGFITAGVAAGMWAHNTTTGIASLVKGVAATDLTLADDIFASGDAYSIGTANPMADGAVYVEVPQFHYVWCEDGQYTYMILNLGGAFSFTKPIAGTTVNSVAHEWFYEGGLGSPAAQKYFSAFESVWYDTSAVGYLDHDGSISAASDDKAVSLPGYKPLTNTYRGTTAPNFRALHGNFGANHHSQGFYAYEAIWLLMTVEYASLNGQAYLPGYTQASTWGYAATRRTGRTMLLGNLSGSIEPALAAGQIDNDVATSYGIVAGEKIANSYRGIENIYGHVWKWVDGININWGTTEGRIYLSNNPSQWAESTDTNYTDTGVGFPLSSGYASALYPGRLLTKLVAGGSTTYLCDYFYQPGASAGWRGLLAGGYLPDGGGGAGPAYLHASTSGSGHRSADVGGRAAA